MSNPSESKSTLSKIPSPEKSDSTLGSGKKEPSPVIAPQGNLDAWAETQAIATLNIGIVLTNGSHEIFKVNHAFHRIMTDSEDIQGEFNGIDPITLVVEEHQLLFDRAREEAKVTRRKNQVEVRMLTADERIISSKITIEPWKGLESTEEVWMYLIEDITKAAQYRLLLEASQELSGVGGWELNVENNSMLWTDEIHRIYGWDRHGDVDLGDALSFFFKESRQRAIEVISQVGQTGIRSNDEFELINAQGKYYQIQTLTKAVHHGDQLLKIYGAFRDITQEKRDHEKIVHSEQLYRNLAENFPKGIILIINRGLELDFAEGQGLNEIGLEKETMRGMHLSFMVTGAEFKRAEDLCWNTLDGQPQQIELSFKDHTYSVETMPLYNPQGIIDRLLWVSYNITDRINWERQLQASEIRYRELFESNPNPIMVVDSDTDRILEVNPTAIKHYGYSIKELTQMKWADLSKSQSSPSDNPYMVGMQEQHATKLGELIFVDVQSTEIEYEDRTARLKIVNDVTEQLMAAQALQTSHKALEEFHMALDAASLVVTFNMAGEFISANENFCEACLLNEEDILGKKLDSFPALVSDDPQIKKVKAHLGKRKIWKGELSLKKSDESDFWLNCTIIPQYQSPMGENLILAICHDITEKKKAEQLRDKYANRSVAILESITDAMLLVSESLGVIFINSQAESLLQQDRNSLVGKNIKEVFPQDKVNIFYSQLLKAQTENTTVHFEEYFAHLRLWAEVHAYPSSEGLSVYFRSINERKQAEDRIRDSENSLKEAQRIARMGNWEYHVGSSEVVWSDELFRLFHLDPIKDTPSLDLVLSKIHREDKLRVFKAIRKAWDQQVAFNLDMRLLREDGIRHINFICRIEVNADGVLEKLYGILTDITERKEAENKVMKSEARLREAQQLGKMGSWEYMPEEQQLNFSEEIYQLLEVSKDTLDVPLMEKFNWVHQEDRPVVQNHIFDALGTGNAFDFDFRISLPSGEVMHLNVIGQPMLSTEKKLLKLYGTLLDITERKRAEEQLRASEEWFKAIFNATKDGIVVERRNEIVFANGALANQFGYDAPEELIGEDIRVLHTQTHLKEFLEMGEKRLAGKTNLPNSFETVCQQKSGTQFDVEIRSSVFEISGDRFLIHTTNDISERKQSEKELRESNEQLKKTNAELDRFVYSASHDLRAPMVSVLGLINLAKIETEANRMGDYLALMEKSVRKLDNFVQEIIHYSRNNRLEVKHDPINFRTLLEGIVEDLQFMEEAKMVRKEIHLDIREDFYTDKNRLAVVINNMVSNAFRYSSPHRRDPYLNIFVTVKGGQASITFEDNGQGIDKEHQADIFKMFYRASENSKGSGLGLYIVQESIDKLQGRVSVTSTLGQGTTFTVVLPSLTPTEHNDSA